MAKRGRFSGGTGYAGIPAQIINQIRSQASGINTSATTDTVVTPKGDTNVTKKREVSRERPLYTEKEISSSPFLSALKRGITYEEALGNYRALMKVLNMSQLAGSKSDPAQRVKYQRAYAALTPEQKASEEIFFALGGSLESNNPKYGGYGWSGDKGKEVLRRLGIDTSNMPQYAPVKFDVSTPANRIEFNLQNPLNQNQRSALQRLRSLKSSGVSLSKRQQARLARLKAKKNAPTIIE